MPKRARTPEEIQEINRAFIAELEKIKPDPAVIDAVTNFTRVLMRSPGGTVADAKQQFEDAFKHVDKPEQKG
jgi:hypothetical protein